MNQHELVPLLVKFKGDYVNVADNAAPIERMLGEIDWAYEKTTGRRAFDQEYIQYSGETYTLANEDEQVIETYPMRLVVDAQSVEVITVFPKKADAADLPRVAEFIARTNPVLKFVRLELDYDTCELYVRVIFPYDTVEANIYAALTYLCKVGTLVLDEYARDILALIVKEQA